MSAFCYHVGQRIKKYRKSRGYTIEQFSVMINKSKATVSKYENGTITIDIDTLYDISFETYLRGELKTYSMQTLVLYGRRIVAFVQEQKNMTEEIMRYTTAFYGYKTLEDAEIK